MNQCIDCGVEFDTAGNCGCSEVLSSNLAESIFPDDVEQTSLERIATALESIANSLKSIDRRQQMERYRAK